LGEYIRFYKDPYEMSQRLNEEMYTSLRKKALGVLNDTLEK
ncbi:4602_t:CDS:1, partial [Dentiscutata erythropus]